MEVYEDFSEPTPKLSVETGFREKSNLKGHYIKVERRTSVSGQGGHKWIAMTTLYYDDIAVV